MPHKARWWTPAGGRILCDLCPRYCRIGEGQAGFCYIRYNHKGVLMTKGYESTTGLALDPVEKKPLYHVFPSKYILSFGTTGCNMGCRFCQNWNISKARREHRLSTRATTWDVIEKATEFKAQGNIGLAFTYNDPATWAEWVIDLASASRYQGLLNVMVTNAYMTHRAIKDVYPLIDAANIDLKSLSENFYNKLTFSHLKPVLDGIIWIKNEGTWVELTNLIIPGYNDDPKDIKELIKWVIQYCGDETPLHFTAFHPAFKMLNVPGTPFSTIKKAYDAAKDAGLKYVYTGNVTDENTGSTYCPNCSRKIIRRVWYNVNITGMSGSRCINCGFGIKGIFAGNDILNSRPA